MLKITYGTPEIHVPSKYCPDFRYTETEVRYPTDQIGFRCSERGCVLTFPMEKDTQIYGLGLQHKQFNHLGRQMRLHVRADPRVPNGDSHAPVPFFVTNKGYGIYIDTARYAEFTFGCQPNPAFGGGAAGQSVAEETSGTRMPAVSTEDLYAVRQTADQLITVQIPVAQGVDVYIIEGKDITDIVSQYNMLSGGGCDAPEWGLGVFYRCYSRYTSEQVLAMADEFIEKDIPLSIMGLEPGWQTHAYSCSYLWSDLYPDPAAFLAEMKKRNIHVNLWEHAFTNPAAPFHGQMAPYSGDILVWGGLVPDFTIEEARHIFADHQRKVLVDAGIDGFKLDECDNDNWSFPEVTRFPSGIDGEQYHSLFGTLYTQVMLEALGENKTFSEVRNLGALAASYPFVLYSDLYEHDDFIMALTTAPFSGLLWSPEVRHAGSKEELLRRLQTVVFSVQCLINAWYCEDLPWRELDCEAEVRDLLQLRMTLIPRLRESFRLYHETGKPPIRALVMDYTDDEEVWNIADQYLFCEDLLVAPISVGKGDTRRVYLPAGSWVDFFTGEAVESGWHDVTTKGIPVYRKV